MAQLVPQGLSELIQDKIVELLENFNREQTALDQNVAFNIYKDKLLPLDEKAENFPLVNIWLPSLNSEVSRSSGRTYQQESANYAIDCYAIGAIKQNDAPDVAAMARLKYLKEQVKIVILSLVNIDFGLEPGLIAKRNWPNFQMFQPDISETENSLAVGRWSFSVEYGYNPEELELLDLKELKVDTNIWEALFNY